MPDVDVGHVIISNGNCMLGDVVALVADDTLGILEGITSYPAGVNSGRTDFLFRADADGALVTKTQAALRLATDEEKTTRADALTLANAQATFDAAKSALDDAGGDSCDGCV